MGKSNPIIQKVLQPDGSNPTDKFLANEEDRKRREEELTKWLEKLKEASLKDGEYPGGRRVEAVLKELIVSVKRDSVEMAVVRLLLKRKGWSLRIQRVAMQERNWRLSK